MEKYIVNFVNRKGRKGKVGVVAQTKEDAIKIFHEDYSQKYNILFASYEVISVDIWRNKIVTE